MAVPEPLGIPDARRGSGWRRPVRLGLSLRQVVVTLAFGLYSPSCTVPVVKRSGTRRDRVTPRNAGHRAPGATDATGEVAASAGKACGGTLKH
jgi:hypothetical protein